MHTESIPLKPVVYPVACLPPCISALTKPPRLHPPAALFGFLRSLFLLLKGPPAPTHFVVVLDSGGVTYR